MRVELERFAAPAVPPLASTVLTASACGDRQAASNRKAWAAAAARIVLGCDGEVDHRTVFENR
ncbi:hypothetical protein J2Y55_003244 [Bosea sp. BE125]|uniref:hypothetical protein n=1 Tax=Bosea sp. BE125 TaxID=2817909 RepID=UPI002866304A|nr:hypothetical protein [Bosea sp. BE125]MDR6872228.1 hypothetical protein [Bosea sp. BE125]